MINLTPDYIRNHIADSAAIFGRGARIYETGAYLLADADPAEGRFVYEVDGSYGDYTAEIRLEDRRVSTRCTCPYPGIGCKHTVAVLLDVCGRLIDADVEAETDADDAPETPETPADPYLTPEEIRQQAIDDRHHRAASEGLELIAGDMIKGVHTVVAKTGREYQVTLHQPEAGRGHCSCPDFLTNRLNLCKHLIFATEALKARPDFQARLDRERFPFVDIYWDSAAGAPRLFNERPASEIEEITPLLEESFDPSGRFTGSSLADLMPLLDPLEANKRVRVQPAVIERLDDHLLDRELESLSENGIPPLNAVRTRLYPYQVEGVKFGLYRKGALIGDEMGLGKTIQAIVLSILKREVFGFSRVLVITLASLKEQWKREIERFTEERAVVVAGGPPARRAIYEADEGFFKITNYEAVLRDVDLLRDFSPDLIILDEAQRIKNFNTKTADAVKRIPRKHALVLTGTPLENKLEDVYSIVQFLDPLMLAPLWQFAADHFMLSRRKKGKIIGYRNLDRLHQRLKSVVIRRKKADVLSDLPDEIVNNYYIDLDPSQTRLHNGYLQSLLPILNKKFITPMDFRRIQELLLCMRRVCDSTYLVDRKTNISPKLKELFGITDELIVENGHKAVIFSEWTTMTFLIAKQLSDAGIPFVELSGKVPVKKRQALIDEFSSNPDCKVFLSTDAGGTGLNLQAADCVINFELPWNPARMNQRIGRVNRIGQRSKCVNVVNLITRNSIEEKNLAGIQLKTDLFEGVFDGKTDRVEFSREKREEMLSRLRQMMGEAPIEPGPPERPADEIPEDTPHYLNPEVLGDRPVAYDEEEAGSDAAAPEGAGAAQRTGAGGGPGGVGTGSPREMESVLNSGMAFLTGVLEMATGQKVETSGDDQRMIHLDPDTGEVTLKFRLPGFSPPAPPQ